MGWPSEGQPVFRFLRFQINSPCAYRARSQYARSSRPHPGPQFRSAGRLDRIAHSRKKSRAAEDIGCDVLERLDGKAEHLWGGPITGWVAVCSMVQQSCEDAVVAMKT